MQTSQSTYNPYTLNSSVDFNNFHFLVLILFVMQDINLGKVWVKGLQDLSAHFATTSYKFVIIFQTQVFQSLNLSSSKMFSHSWILPFRIHKCKSWTQRHLPILLLILPSQRQIIIMTIVTMKIIKQHPLIASSLDFLQHAWLNLFLTSTQLPLKSSHFKGKEMRGPGAKNYGQGRTAS